MNDFEPAQLEPVSEADLEAWRLTDEQLAQQWGNPEQKN